MNDDWMRQNSSSTWTQGTTTGCSLLGHQGTLDYERQLEEILARKWADPSSLRNAQVAVRPDNNEKLLLLEDVWNYLPTKTP